MAEQRRGEPASKAKERHEKAKSKYKHTPKVVTTIIAGGKPGTYTEGGKKVVAISHKQHEALERVHKKPKTSPSDAEREAVGEGRAMFNKRGRKALREESMGTKLRSFGRSLKRKVTGRKASRNSGR